MKFKNEKLTTTTLITNTTLFQTKKNNGKLIKRKNNIYSKNSISYNYPNSINFDNIEPGTYNLYVHLIDSSKRVTATILEIKIKEGSNSIDQTITFDTVKTSNGIKIPIKSHSRPF